MTNQITPGQIDSDQEPVSFIEGEGIFPLPTYITRPRSGQESFHLSLTEVLALQAQLRRDIALLERLIGDD